MTSTALSCFGDKYCFRLTGSMNPNRRGGCKKTVYARLLKIKRLYVDTLSDAQRKEAWLRIIESLYNFGISSPNMGRRIVWQMLPLLYDRVYENNPLKVDESIIQTLAINSSIPHDEQSFHWTPEDVIIRNKLLEVVNSFYNFFVLKANIY